MPRSDRPADPSTCFGFPPLMSEPEPAELRRTPLFEAHRDLGAKLSPFAGFEMPIQYAGIMEEHLAVRNRAGLFDISHMGEIELQGPDAASTVQQLIVSDAEALSAGRARYTVMCTREGGIVDDLLVYRRGDELYLLVVNAANIEKDFEWIRRHSASADVSVTNRSPEIAQLALQGPAAFTVLEKAFGITQGTLDRFRFLEPDAPDVLAEASALVSETGYTGEHGVEIYCDAEGVRPIWERLLEEGQPEGLQPAGLGARDTLRLEAGLTLYGHEIDEETHPYEAGLGWLVDPDSGPFLGLEALRRIEEEGWDRQLQGFILDERGVPRRGYPLTDEKGAAIGTVTSGTQSPVLERGIGLGYLPQRPPFQDEDTPVGIQIRGRTVPARTKRPPLHEDAR